jgi:hypothetical protein
MAAQLNSLPRKWLKIGAPGPLGQYFICLSKLVLKQSCALLKINFLWKPMCLLRTHECVFRICTGDGLRGVYAVALLQILDAWANSFNDSGGIRSGSIGERWLPVSAGACRCRTD